MVLKDFFSKISSREYTLLCIAILGVFALVLFLMGQPLLCECGYIKLWHGVTLSSENSQHLSDWYSFSHIIHGFVFYWVLWLVGKKKGWPLGLMLVLAIVAETSWEVFENTDMVINRYRAVTISLDYFGDSVINSVFDVLFMVLGFFLARRIPVFATIILIVAMEVLVGYFIRDGLLLNIVMLLYPFQGILEWQNGG